MSLDSEGIQKKEFHIVFKGYKPEEVDKFLDMLSIEFDGMQKKIKELEEEFDSLKYEGDKESSKMKIVLQEALISAHKVAEEIKQKAKIEAEELISNKKIEEEQEINKLKEEKESLESNIIGLKSEYNDFKDQLTKFADDLKQRTLDFKDNHFTDEPEKSDPDLMADQGNATVKKEGIDVEKDKKDKATGDPGKSINKKEDISSNELDDLASLTEEMFEKLNRKEKTDKDSEKIIKKPEVDKKAGDTGKTNRKKIDIANPDIINDFFNADGD